MTTKELILNNSKKLTLEELSEIIIKKYDISYKALTGRARTSENVFAKIIFANVALLLGYTQKEIGVFLNRHRTTIVNYKAYNYNIFQPEYHYNYIEIINDIKI